MPLRLTHEEFEALQRKRGITIRSTPKPKREWKLEGKFLHHLQLHQLAGDIPWIGDHSLRFELGGGAWYRPDFHIAAASRVVPGFLGEMPPEILLVVYEVKGHWREPARVRVKVAASRHRYAKLIAVQEERGWWKYEEIRP
jgi:hypothetical protein